MTVRELRTFLENVVDQDMSVCHWDTEFRNYYGLDLSDVTIQNKLYCDGPDIPPFVGIK